MFCKLNSYSLNGIDTLPIEIEIDLSEGLPSFDIVGLPDSSVKEAKERVKSAIKNSGYKFPICRITVNLAPADLRKEGSLYDLPIALGILCCMGKLPLSSLSSFYFIGELALDGSLRGIRGLLPILCTLRQKAFTACIVPAANEKEASLLSDLPILLAQHLTEVVHYLIEETPLKTANRFPYDASQNVYNIDYSDVKGQAQAKRGLMLAAAGYHNLILIGPPGSGKTMLAQRLVTILPALTEEEALSITKIYSVAHQLKDQGIIRTRPFRAPHHTISLMGLSGGGFPPLPGEISLAHLGVLFLDELLEFNRKTLETLRQPLESHHITLSRAQHTFTYPANFLFIASTNPCPCGYYPDIRCTCSTQSIKRYLSKLSGPLLDRLDLQIETHTPTLDELKDPKPLSSDTMYHTIQIAYERQQFRYQQESFSFNSQIPAHYISHYCQLTSAAQTLLNDWFKHNNTSIRSYDKILRIALTLADLNQKDTIQEEHIAEALQYRLLDRTFWP